MTTAIVIRTCFRSHAFAFFRPTIPQWLLTYTRTQSCVCFDDRDMLTELHDRAIVSVMMLGCIQKGTIQARMHTSQNQEQPSLPQARTWTGREQHLLPQYARQIIRHCPKKVMPAEHPNSFKYDTTSIGSC